MTTLFNGRFDFWSRGPSFTVQGASTTADGFLCGSGVGGSIDVSKQMIQLNTPVLPSDARFCMRMQWTAPGTMPSSPDGFMTVLEHGEVYGAPLSDGGVRRFAGRSVAASIYACVAQGPVPLRVIMWQSFGYGPEASPMVLLTGGVAQVESSWMQVGAIFNVPTLDGKVIGSGGQDYLGFGVDISSGYAPTLYLAYADVVPV